MMENRLIIAMYQFSVCFFMVPMLSNTGFIFYLAVVGIVLNALGCVVNFLTVTFENN